MCLKVLPKYESKILYVKLKIWQEHKTKKTFKKTLKKTLKLKYFFKRLEVLKTILALQKGKRLCNNLMSPDLVKADIFLFHPCFIIHCLIDYYYCYLEEKPFFLEYFLTRKNLFMIELLPSIFVGP